jgi:hypothetical protein
MTVHENEDAMLAKLTVLAEADAHRAGELVIYNDEDYSRAAVLLREIKRNHQEGLAEYEAIYNPLWQAVEAMRARRAEVIDPWERAEQSLKRVMATYHEKRVRELEERRIAAAEVLMADIDQVEDPKEVVERAAAAKVELQKIPDEGPEADGISYRDNWKARVVDPRALALAVGNNELPEDYVTPNMTLLNKLAASLKEHFAGKVAGCIAENNRVLQVRKR